MLKTDTYHAFDSLEILTTEVSVVCSQAESLIDS